MILDEKFEAKMCSVSGKPDGTNLLDRDKLSISMDIDNPDILTISDSYSIWHTMLQSVYYDFLMPF